MADIYLYTLASVFVISLISLVGIFTLSLQEWLLRKYIFLLVSLAIGALLGDAFIHLLPESFETLDATTAGILIILGVLLFLILEKFLHWHHTHGLEDECEVEHGRAEGVQTPDGTVTPVGYIVLVSDSIHNLLDGIIIGASYFVSIEVGIATTIAVVLHEIPQEIGDFGILIHSGFSRGRALLVNFVTALTAFLGAFLVLFLHESVESVVPWVVPLAAGGFIYIAASDLIPELHKTKGVGQSFLQLIAIAVGVGAMVLLVFVEA